MNMRDKEFNRTQALYLEWDIVDKTGLKTVHEINPAVANAYGIPAALIFQHIKTRCAQSELDWALTSLTSLCRLHPYLGRAALYRGLTTLIRGTEQSPALLQRRSAPDSPVVYMYALFGVSADSREHLHCFDTDLALKLGATAALVYATLQRQTLRWGRADTEKGRAFSSLVGLCHQRLYYVSARTLHRQITSLLEANLICKKPAGGRVNWALLPPVIHQN